MRVITFNNPWELRSHPEWRLIQNTPHICATESLRYGMAQQYKPYGLKTISATTLFRHLLPRWFAPMAQVGQFARLTGSIDAIRQERPSWAERLRAFRRSQPEVLRSIRTLSEGGLRPEDIAATTDDERIFRVLWERMEEADPLLQYLRSRMTGAFEQSDTLRQALLKAFASAAEEMGDESLRLSRVDQFILDGFYFLTPLRMRMIRLMEQAGISFVSLVCWDERYESIFTGWERFFPDKSTWAKWGGKPPAAAGQLFGNIYEGRVPLVASGTEGPQLLRFPDTTSFLQYVEEQLALPATEQPIFCSPAHAQLNDMLRDLFPDRFPERHFLAYPVGQFLSHLHQMWDEESETLVFTENALTACFASGLLRVRAGNRWVEGRALAMALKQSLPYFSGCRETAEWVTRAEQLVHAVKNVLPGWDTDVPESDPAHRFHAVLANPLRVLSHLQLNATQAEDLCLLLKRLDGLARHIFADPRVSLHEHLKRLKQLLEDGGADEHLLSEEKQLLRDLMATFTDEHLVADEVPTKDLAQAMAVFLGAIGRADDGPGFSRGLIRDFSSIDGLALSGEPLHICLLNDWALPGKRPVIPWPLSVRSFRDGSLEAVQMLAVSERTAAQSALYLFYYALAFAPAVTLSWVSEWEEQRQNESVYLVMLKAAGVSESAIPYATWGDQSEPSSRAVTLLTRRPWQADLYPVHALAEYASCPRRFYYSYISGSTPRFDTDFHLEFLYGRLLGWYMWRFPGTSRPDARGAIDPLFPAWPEVRLRDLAQRWGNYSHQKDVYQGKQYNWVQRWLLVPAFTKLRGVAEVFESSVAQNLVRAELGQDMAGHPQMKATPGPGCRYCPHISYCAAAHLPIDDE